MIPSRGDAAVKPAWIVLLASAWMAAVFASHARETLAFLSSALRDFPHPAPAWGARAASLWALHGLRAAGVAAFFWMVWRTGRALLRRLDLKDRFPAEICAGLIVWSLSGFLLAALGISTPGVLRGVSALSVLSSLPALWAHRKDILSRLEPLRRPLSLERGLPIGLLVLVGVVCALPSATPELFCDSLVYVLPLPEAYLRAGRLVDLPGNLISRYPGLGQTLYMWGLAWGDERWCKLMNLALGGLWAGVAGRWIARRWGPEAGLWSAAFLLSSPFVTAYIWSCTYDPLSGLMAFTAFILWLEAWASPSRNALLFLSGLCLGGAGAAKYTAAFGLPFYLIDLLWRRRGEARAAGLVLFGLGGLIPLLPWWIRNAVFAGNPFFPYAAAWLGHLSSAQKELLALLGPEQRGSPRFVDRLLTLAVKSVSGARDGRFAFVGPALLSLLPFAFLLRRGEKEEKAAAVSLALYAAASYGAFSSSSGLLRYYMPHLGALFGLAGMVLASLGRRGGPWTWLPRSLAAGIVLFQSVVLLLVFHLFYNGFDFLSGQASKAEYLRADHPLIYKNPSEGAYARLREEAGPGTKVYVLGETRVFRCPGEHYGNWLYDLPLYVRWFQDGLTPEGFVARLGEEGFTHVLVNPPEVFWAVAERYRTKEWTDRLGRVFDLLPPPIHRDSWTILFRVPPRKAREP